MLLNFAIVFLLVLLNGFLALSELAVVSSSRARLQAMADGGSAGARAALALAEQPGHFLSAVQIGITLIGLVAGAFSGTAIAEPLGERLAQWGMAARFSGFVAFAGVVTVVTYLSLIVGELVPKRLALQHPERMAAFVARPMQMLTRVAWPLVVLLETSSRLVLGLLGVPLARKSRVTREEIKALIAEAERAGEMPPPARSMTIGAIHLSERNVQAIMTPRHEVEWLDLDQDEAAVRAQLKASTHTRLPAAHGALDQVAGVVRAKDLLDAFLSGKAPDARDFVLEAPAVIDSVSALQAMETLRSSRAHMVLVVDEYGTFRGLITTTNILEAIAGEFPARGEGPGPVVVQRADGSWLLDGDLPAERMAEELGLVLPSRRDYHTVAGFVLAGIMRIPNLGESFRYRGWRFEVVDLDGPRIDKVLAVRTGERRPHAGQ